MTDNVIEIREPQTIAAEINAIRKRAARQMLEDSVEVGRLLTEAKRSVGHGDWGNWLDVNFAYSTSEANNLMRLYEAYGTPEQIGIFEEDRMAIFGNLSKSQAIALLGLPEPQRREFVENHDVENLSVRDMEAEIARIKEEAQKERDEVKHQLYDAQQKITELESAPAPAAEITDEQKAEIAATAREEALAESAGKIAALEAEATKLRAAADPVTTKFAVQFDIFQTAYNRMQEIIDGCGDDALAQKLIRAKDAALSKMMQG